MGFPKRHFRLVAFIIASFAASVTAHADPWLFAGAGVLAGPVLKVSSSDTGSAGIVPPLAFPIEISARVWELHPSIFGTPLASGQDGAAIRVVALNVPYVFDLGPVALKAGLGLWANLRGGSGDTVTLNNGTGTANFFAPDSMHISYIWSLNAGVGSLFFNFLRVDLDAYVLGVLSSRRSIHLFLRASYGFL